MPVGLEHDGHILGEGARLIIDGTNRVAIVLQKASTLTCNDVELRGTFNEALQAMSGSMLAGRFLSDVPAVSATTGASVNLETVAGKTIGKLTVTRGGVITLPDRTLSAK